MACGNCGGSSSTGGGSSSDSISSASGGFLGGHGLCFKCTTFWALLVVLALIALLKRGR